MMRTAKIKQFFNQFLYYTLALLVVIFSMALLNQAIAKTDWHDLDVFINSAKAALEGRSIYIISGKYDLPFWYLPWTAWSYIPLAIWPRTIAIILYACVSGISILWVVVSLAHHYNPRFGLLDIILTLFLILIMGLQNIIVGQMDYILLGLIVIIMYAIEKKKDMLAGLLFPLLWIKPHLVIVFTLFAFWRGGKRTVFISLSLSAFMLLLETLLFPGWISEMLALLRGGAERTKSVGFTTLPNLLGSQENWVGTANLPFTILLIVLTILIVWKFRSLPTLQLLSFSLAASLFCAPRAHAYDLVLLIPAMLWLTAEKFKSTFWLWIVGAIIPFLAVYSTNSYLLTLLVFIVSVWKAYDTLHSKNILAQEKALNG